MEQDIYSLCRGQMDPDEHILWQGRPKPKGLCLTGTEPLQLCFGIGFTVLSLLFLAIGWINVGPDPLIIGFTIAFPAGGLLVIVSSLRNGSEIKNHTEYAITNKRIFRRIGTRVEHFSNGLSDGYETVLHRDGTATISFTSVVDPGAGRYFVNGREVLQPLCLVHIADVDAVQRALSALNCPSA